MRNLNSSALGSILHLCCTCLLFAAQEKQNTPLVLNNADFNQNTYRDGKLISYLKGNVSFTWDDAIIHSDEVTWYRSEGKVLFAGNIRIVIKEQLLTCKQMEVEHRDNKKATAQGAVEFIDPEANVRINSGTAVYYFNEKRLALSDNPVMLQFDTVHHETLAVRGKQLFYDDSMKYASAVDDVQIKQGLLVSHCQKAVYFTTQDRALLRVNPVIDYDIHHVKGDSIDLFFSKKVLKGIAVMRNAYGYYKDISPKDTFVSTVNGDSIHMTVAGGSKIRTIDTWRDASFRYVSAKDSSAVNNATGKVLQLRLAQKNNARLTIAGNAESVYYFDDPKNPGRNEASGDTIVMYFNEGKFHQVRVRGDVRGTYFAQTVR